MILSVAIPTFNRQDYLRETVTALLDQIQSNNLVGQVEICVSNNASTDGTRAMLDIWQHHHPAGRALRVQHLPELDGANLRRASLMATGEWTWLLGDDDLPYSRAIPWILEEMEDQRPDLILLGYDFQLAGGQVFPNKFTDRDHRYSVPEEIAQWFRDTTCLGGVGGLISTVVARTPAMLRGYAETDGLSVSYPHLAAILWCIQNGLINSVQTRTWPYFLYRAQNERGWTDPRERVMIDVDAWRLLSPLIPANARAGWMGLLRKHHCLR